MAAEPEVGRNYGVDREPSPEAPDGHAVRELWKPDGESSVIRTALLVGETSPPEASRDGPPDVRIDIPKATAPGTRVRRTLLSIRRWLLPLGRKSVSALIRAGHQMSAAPSVPSRQLHPFAQREAGRQDLQSGHAPSTALPDPFDNQIILSRQRLANRESAFGFNHPAVADELHYMAAIYQEAGGYDTAIALYSAALAIRERTLGPSHSQVASTLEDLSSARRDSGETEEAETLLWRARQIRSLDPADAADQRSSGGQGGDTGAIASVASPDR
jgi:hypothetical protein